MTTYDAIRNRTTVWIQRPSRTAVQRHKIEDYGEWQPLFWFHGHA